MPVVNSPTITRPNPTRYQINAEKVLLATNFSSHAIETYPTISDTAPASSVLPQPTPSAMCRYCVTVCSAPAATSAGIPKKKLSLVAATLSNPRNRPAEIVAPERLTPGMSAKHCIMPIANVSFQVVCSSVRGRLARRPARSASHNTTLQPIRPAATNHRLRNTVSISSLNNKPITAIGTEPTIIAQPYL